MTTAVHSSTNNSKTEVVSSLKAAYSSEGVSTLNMAGKIEFLKPSAQHYSPTIDLWSHKVQEAKWLIFGPFHGLLAHRRQCIPQEVLIPVC